MSQNGLDMWREKNPHTLELGVQNPLTLDLSLLNLRALRFNLYALRSSISHTPLWVLRLRDVKIPLNYKQWEKNLVMPI